MFNVRLAGGHLYGKQLFTWLSLVVSLMASFVLSFFPLDVLDEIWDLIESVSEGCLTYSSFGAQMRNPSSANRGSDGLPRELRVSSPWWAEVNIYVGARSPIVNMHTRTHAHASLQKCSYG